MTLSHEQLLTDIRGYFMSINRQKLLRMLFATLKDSYSVRLGDCRRRLGQLPKMKSECTKTNGT